MYQLTKKDDAPEIPPSDKDGWTYSIVGNELNVKKSNTTHKYSLKLVQSDAGENGKTNENGELKYTDLKAGYYYVEENLQASVGYEVQGDGNAEKTITSASKPFIVAVPMTNAEGTDWNDDVHVYPKNEGLNPEKKPSVPSVNVGDKVEWTITVNVPSDIGTYTVFNIIDNLDKRLTYAGNLVVEGLNDNGVAVITLAENTDYNLTIPADKTDGGTVSVNLKSPEGIEHLANNKNVVKLSVSFETTVNGNIGNDDDNTIKNDATIEFTNDSRTDTDKTPSSEIHTGEIEINKTYSGGTVDESAQFQLAKTDVAAKAGEYLRVVLDPTNTHIVDIVAPGETGYDTAKKWVALPSQSATKETLGLVGDTFYVISFEGLKTYDDSTKNFESYYLVETKAPEGYNLLDKPLEVKFTDADSDKKHVHTEGVENKRGFTLPNTGGVGTILLVVVGIILIGLAIILTMNKKKKTA